MKRFSFITIAAIAAIIFFINTRVVRAADCQRYCLSNGLTVLIKESRKAPLTVVEAQVRAGSAAENGYLGSGISHFVEHMLFKGTSGRPRPGEIEREVKALGGYINGFTSHDSSGFQIIVPSEYTVNALAIMKDILTDPLFDPAQLEKERQVILKEIRLNQDDPGRYLSLLLWSNMFKAHNYRFPVIGYEGLFEKLSREDLIKYHSQNYIPDNIVLGVAGDIDTAQALEKIKGLFETIERVSPGPYFSPQEGQQIAGAEVEEEKDLSIAYMSMGFHTVPARDKDLFGLDVLSIILGRGADSRLFKGLYLKKGLVYSIGSASYTPRDPGIFAITAALKIENIDPAIDEIWKQIEDLKKRPVAEAELEKAKNMVLSGYVFSRQTIEEEAGDLIGNEIVVGDFDFSKKYVEGIKAVGAKAVLDAANKYLRKENLTLVKLLPRHANKKSNDAAVKTTSLANIEIEKRELKNGLRVLFAEDHTLPISFISVVGQGGVRTEQFTNNGIASLTADSVLCGTTTRGEEEIFSQIEGIGAGLTSSSGNNSFTISASCLSKDFNTTLGIFSDCLQNPAFAQEKIGREKLSAIGNIRATQDNIYQSGARTLKHILFKRHPYRFQVAGRIGAVSAISRKDIIDYYRTYYCPANMVMVVSGDIDRKAALEEISRLFERLKKRPCPRISPPKEAKRVKPRVVARATDKGQSLVLLGYLGTTIDSHDRYALDILTSVLSGVNGRLSDSIREKRGLAYALDATSVPGIERGMIIFYAGTTRENLDRVKTELFNEIESLRKSGITDEELRAAKNELAGFQKISLQKIHNIGVNAALDELYGLGFKDFLNYEGRIRHITKECVVRAARKYLNPNSYALLLIKGK